MYRKDNFSANFFFFFIFRATVYFPSILKIIIFFQKLYVCPKSSLASVSSFYPENFLETNREKLKFSFALTSICLELISRDFS